MFNLLGKVWCYLVIGTLILIITNCGLKKPGPSLAESLRPNNPRVKKQTLPSATETKEEEKVTPADLTSEEPEENNKAAPLASEVEPNPSHQQESRSTADNSPAEKVALPKVAIAPDSKIEDTNDQIDGEDQKPEESEEISPPISEASDDTGDSEEPIILPPLEPMPDPGLDFSLSNLEGITQSLASFDTENKRILLIFFSIYCMTCYEEAKIVQTEYLKNPWFNQNYQVISVSVGESIEDTLMWKDFAEFKITFPILVDSDSSVFTETIGEETFPLVLTLDSKRVELERSSHLPSMNELENQLNVNEVPDQPDL